MSISRFSRLHGCGIFREFDWPAGLADLSRFNLIYGWNGSGKTTVSNILRALERRTAPLGREVVLQVDSHAVRGTDFPSSNLAIRVFNRDYVTESVFPVGGGELPPIFVIGQENVEQQRRAETLKVERAAAEATLNQARSRKAEGERAFDRHRADRARAIKDALRATGSEFNNYDRTDYAGAAQLMSAGTPTEHQLDDESRDALLAQHRATPKPKVPEVTIRFPSLDAMSSEVRTLLSETIVSTAIDSLRRDPPLAAWTRQGLDLHRSRSADICLFCEQPMPASRLESLEAHFSTAFERFVARIDDALRRVDEIARAATAAPLPHSTQLYDDLAPEYTTAEEALRAAIARIVDFAGSVQAALVEKRERPFEVLSHALPVPEISQSAVDRLNGVIRRHNEVCDDFESRTTSARERLAADMVASTLNDYVQLREAFQSADGAVRDAEATVRRLTAEIDGIEREIVAHQRPADELNAHLREYLGHGELHLATHATGYQITRGGTPAIQLSEGEATAISLLYFLRSLEDRGGTAADRVIVLDDPVSSLDHNAIFAAFGFIRARAGQARQLIILTHNFLFFRLVREWFGNLRGLDKRLRRTLMLECIHTAEGRSAGLREIDPMLQAFDSEYHYLFSRIYRMATEPQAPSLEAYYCAPSMARRVVEAFLSFRVPDLVEHNRLWNQIDAIPFDTAKKARIYRFLQTHAHRDAVGDADEDLTQLSESRAILSAVLDFMRAADADHVDRMIARVCADKVGTSE